MRALREAVGYDVNMVAAHVGVNRTTVQRWESGGSSPKAGTIRELGRLYDAPPQTITRLVDLSATVADRSVWESINVPRQLRLLYESEGTADSICIVELALIPALAQTVSYLRAVQEAEFQPPEARKAVEQTWEHRQRLVFTQPSPKVHMLIGSSALTALETLPPTLREEQINRLRELSALPSVEIGVLHGLHAAMVGGFQLIAPRPASLGRPFVVLESADGCRYDERAAIVSRYERIWNRVRETASALEDHLHDSRKVAEIHP